MAHVRQYSLVFPLKTSKSDDNKDPNECVLLGLKKRGFGEGLWNGFGGKRQPNESIFQCAERELLEECNLQSVNLQLIGRILFEFVKGVDQQQDVSTFMDVVVFLCRQWEGEVKESEEMLPKWFRVADIPYDQMWADDQHWYPYALKNQPFKAYFQFQGCSTIIDKTIVSGLSEKEILEDWHFIDNAFVPMI